MMAAVAELDENWKEHESLWDQLVPSDLPVVRDAEDSIAELRAAIANAGESDLLFQESLERFASLGPETEEVTRGLRTRLGGVREALGEYLAQADSALRTLQAIVGRLDSSHEG